jgi:hypothetical protein
MALLKQIAADQFASNKDKLAAIKILNDMCGLNQPQKLEMRQEVIEIGFEDENSIK